jgi:hypothetical protein
VQTAEGELRWEIPQVREAAEPFVSRLFPRGTKLLCTEPLRAMIGAFVRGQSMRDIELLCEQAGLGKLSKATASRMHRAGTPTARIGRGAGRVEPPQRRATAAQLGAAAPQCFCASPGPAPFPD